MAKAAFSESESKSYIECVCGKTQIGLHEPICKYASICCCTDCRQRTLIAASNNKTINEQMQDTIHFKKGAELVFFSNSLIIGDEIKKLLKFEKLRENGSTIHCIATCCGTMMCAAHPLYKGQSIVCFPDGPKIVGVKLMEPQVITWGKDWRKDQYDAYIKGKDIMSLPDPSAEQNKLMAFMTALQKEAQITEKAIKYEELFTEKDITFNNAFFKESRINTMKK